MAMARLRNVDISYQQFGAGPDMVMIHGLAANRAFWFRHAAGGLARKFRVTIYDLRGHGYSSIPASGYTTADMAGDLEQLLDHLAIDRAVLVGHSYGGAVALHFAVAHPSRVAALVIADSRIHALQPVQRLEDTSIQSSLEELLVTAEDVDWRNEEHAGMRMLEIMARSAAHAPGRRRNPGDFSPFGRGGAQRTAKRWLKLLETTTAHQDFRDSAGLTAERIETVSCPVLTVYGERSRCLHSWEALRNLLPHLRSHLVPGAGHFHPATRYGQFMRALGEFLRDLDYGTGPEWAGYAAAGGE